MRTEPDHANATPYELYIRLPQLMALWPPASHPWSGAVIATCGLQAAELTLRLVEDAMTDERPSALCETRITRYLQHLVEGFDFTCRLLGRSADAPSPVTLGRPSRAPSPGFRILGQLAEEQRTRVTARLLLATSTLGFSLGIEEQLESAQSERSVQRQPPDDLPTMDYGAVVSPEAIHRLREKAPFGPEDHLFSTVHQITECWLNIAHQRLEQARSLALSCYWSEGAEAVADANDALGLSIQAGQLLDQMVLADYHPLRVHLRDGSGAQSPAARRLGPAINDAAECLWTALDGEQKRIADILERPREHIELYRYLTNVKAIGKQHQSFLFHHYLLALGVLGAHSYGSLGYAIAELAKRAVAPVFPELNSALHDYVMLTNFQYGDGSGAIVFKNERASGSDPYVIEDVAASCPRGLVETQVLAYFRAIEERDAEAWVELFHPERGQLQDVEGTRPYLGKARLRVFICGMFRAFREMRATCAPPRIDGNTASVQWQFDAVSYHGIATQLNGREDFQFDDQGKILRAVAHWRPTAVAEQWQQALQQETPDRARHSLRESHVRSLLQTTEEEVNPRSASR